MREKINNGSSTLIVKLERDGIIYHIINPQYYFSGRMCGRNDIEQLTQWMNEIEIGKSYSFQLERPMYPIDSVINFPQIKSGENNLYVGGGEAYGYFFARRVRK